MPAGHSVKFSVVVSDIVVIPALHDTASRRQACTYQPDPKVRGYRSAYAGAPE
jgi:hypothetical protein